MPNDAESGFSTEWISWGERWDLNPRPSVPQTDALPAELRSPQGAEKQFTTVSVRGEGLEKRTGKEHSRALAQNRPRGAHSEVTPHMNGEAILCGKQGSAWLRSSPS